MAANPAWWLVLLMCGILVSFSDCQTCTISSETGKKSESGNIVGYEVVADQAACESNCLSDGNCMAANFNPGNLDCILVGDTPTTPYPVDADFILLIKTCSTDPCTMTSTANTKGNDTKLQLTQTDAELCGTVCLYLQECIGVRYSGDTCHIYTGTASDSNSGDTLTQLKDVCSDKACCMTATTLKASAPAVVSLQSTVASCEEACLKVSDCFSVYFRDNHCYMYTAEPETSAETGSTYSVRSCTGTPMFDFTSTVQCYGSSGSLSPLNVSLLFVLLLLSLAIL